MAKEVEVRITRLPDFTVELKFVQLSTKKVVFSMSGSHIFMLQFMDNLQNVLGFADVNKWPVLNQANYTVN